MIKSDAYHTIYKLREEKDQDLYLTDILEVHVIEMKKVKKEVEVPRELKKWLEFLDRDKTRKELEELVMKDEKVRKAYEKLERIEKEPLVKSLYEWYEEALHEEATKIETAYDKGIEEGKIEVIKYMLKSGLSLDEISRAIGMEVVVINKLLGN